MNSFEYGQDPELYAGDQVSVYLQLVDESTGSMSSVATPYWATFGVPSGGQQVLGAARRYMPAAGATLQVTLDSVDDAQKIVRYATQPFAQDASIWRLDLAPADPITGTVDLRFLLLEGSVPHRALLRGGLRVRSTVRI